MQETRVGSLGREDPPEWQAAPAFLLGKFRGQSGLAGHVHGVTKAQTWLRSTEQQTTKLLWKKMTHCSKLLLEKYKQDYVHFTYSLSLKFAWNLTTWVFLSCFKCHVTSDMVCWGFLDCLCTMATSSFSFCTGFIAVWNYHWEMTF